MFAILVLLYDKFKSLFMDKPKKKFVTRAINKAGKNHDG